MTHLARHLLFLSFPSRLLDWTSEGVCPHSSYDILKMAILYVSPKMAIPWLPSVLKTNISGKAQAVVILFVWEIVYLENFRMWQTAGLCCDQIVVFCSELSMA